MIIQTCYKDILNSLRAIETVNIQSKSNQLLSYTASLTLRWVSNHSEIKRNETAGMLERNAVNDHLQV